MRPERVRIDDQPPGACNATSGLVEVVSFLGTGAQAVLRLAGGRALLAEGPAALADRIRPGQRVTAHWTAADLTPIPAP